MANYSLDNLLKRAQHAKVVHKKYVDELLRKYDHRSRLRKKSNVPVIGFCGYGRAGKDTIAQFFCEQAGLVYPGSNSMVILPLVATMAEEEPTKVFEERHNQRDFWIDACHAIRHGDYSLLIKMSLGAGDVAVGIRGRLELYHSVKEEVLDWTIWIENDRVEKDRTTEYTSADCDDVWFNNGPYFALYARIERFIAMLRASGMQNL